MLAVRLAAASSPQKHSERERQPQRSPRPPGEARFIPPAQIRAGIAKEDHRARMHILKHLWEATTRHAVEQVENAALAAKKRGIKKKKCLKKINFLPKPSLK